MTTARVRLLLLATVIANALLQALLVLGDPTPEASLLFVLGVLLSGALWLATYATILGGTLRRRPTWRFFAWTLLLWFVIAVALLPFNGIPGLLILAATPYLPLAAMDGAGHPIGANFRTIGRAPIRFAWRIIAVALLVVVSWLLLALDAFFIAVPVSAFVNSLAIGLVGWLVTWSFARVYRAKAGPAAS